MVQWLITALLAGAGGDERMRESKIDAKHILICTKSSGACNLY